MDEFQDLDDAFAVESPQELEESIDSDLGAIDEPVLTALDDLPNAFSEVSAVSDINSDIISGGLGDLIGDGKGTRLSGKGFEGSFLGTKGSGSRIAFVLDYSSSQSAAQIAVQKAELIGALEKFSDGAQVSIIFFSGPVFMCGQSAKEVKHLWRGNNSTGWFPKTPSNPPQAHWTAFHYSMRETLRQQILETKRSSGTDWYHPIKMALDLSPKPDVIFFMTDGNVPNPTKTVAMVRAKAGKTKINTIGFGLGGGKGKAGKGVEALTQIAGVTRGEFRAYSKDQIQAMYNKLDGEFDPVRKKKKSKKK
jgi:hypothetical protein